MRASDFIIEAGVKPYRYTKLDVDQTVATLNHYCSEAFAMALNPLWRGMSNHTQKMFVVDPSTGVRKSNNTRNYYTEFFDHSPYMQGWPKRSQSFICSSGTSYARGYGYGGGLYALFPFNGVKIAVCPERDMWETPVYIPSMNQQFTSDCGMDDFNDWVQNRAKLPIDQWKDMVKRLMKPTWLENTEFDARTRKVLTSVDGKAPGEVFLDIVFKALAPVNTGMRLLTISEYASERIDNKECWVSGPMVAIRQDVYEGFKSAITKGAPAGQTSAQPVNTFAKKAP